MKASCEVLDRSLSSILRSGALSKPLEESSQSGCDATLDDLGAATVVGVAVVSGAMWAGNGQMDSADGLSWSSASGAGDASHADSPVRAGGGSDALGHCSGHGLAHGTMLAEVLLGDPADPHLGGVGI